MTLGALTAFAALPARAIAQSAEPGRATLVGTVLADSSERPVANATVAIAALGLTTVTDSSGNFTLPSIAAGLHTVTVRAVGYALLSTRLPLRDGQRLETDFLLRRTVQTLEEVDVRAAAPAYNNPRMGEFEARRKMGLGRFMTQEEFEKGEGRKLSEVLTSRWPGLHPVSYGGRRALASSRGINSVLQMPNGDGTDRSMGAPVRCYVQVIIDGLQRYASKRGEQLLNIDSIDPSTITAAEYYSVSQTPAQFNMGGNAPCGTLVLWTRWR